MSQTFNIYPAYADRPAVYPLGDGVVFSAVFRDREDHGLQLIHLPDKKTIYIPFTDNERFGSVYSVRLEPFDASCWLYRYRSGSKWLIDPCAFSIRKVTLCEGGKEEEAEVCSCHPLYPVSGRAGTEGGQRSACAALPALADWNSQVIYGLHVKGFTAAGPENLRDRGTFNALASRIPYLRSLGVTAVELMPVCTPLPGQQKRKKFRTMEEALRAWPVGPQGDPLRDMKDRPNYWGFGRALYYALRAEYGTQEDFVRMVSAFHRAGIRVLLQLYFTAESSLSDQLEIIRWYVRRFGIDGFRLLGHLPSPSAIAADPALTDTALVFGSFSLEEFRRSEREDEELHARHILTRNEDYTRLLRCFVKSDDYVMKDFLKLFLASSAEHGEIRAVTDYEGFTLADLVSYNERHNEANGEFGLDGREDNYSWNCGEEGESSDPEVLALRRKQIRNFLTLLVLSRGTPYLRQGDERYHTQYGNNNPYCQDNEISWVDWTASADCDQLTAFTASLIDFRKRHPVFHSRRPIHYMDLMGIGHPDVSLHGQEAWKPDLGAFSHSIGIAICENYFETEESTWQPSAGNTLPLFNCRGRAAVPSFLYLAVNMYWKELSLALPKLPPHVVWKVVLDTETDEGFFSVPADIADVHSVQLAPRSIKILRAIPDMPSVFRERHRDLRAALPPVGALKRQYRTARIRGKELQRRNRGMQSRRVRRTAQTFLAPRDRMR